MINIVSVNKYIRENKLQGPITSPQIFMGKSTGFHPQGLFSEEIFGIEGSSERRNTQSWIELKCQVINPVIYDILTKSVERKISKLLASEQTFTINAEGNLIEDDEGEIIGFSKFSENIDKIKFRKVDDEEKQRNKIVDMIQGYIKTGDFFIDKLIIVSPEIRPVSIGEDQQDTMIDEMNELYQRIIQISNQIKGVAGTMFDVLSYKMQLLFKDLFEFIKVKVAKKEGLIRSSMLGKRVDFSARAVISPQPKLRLGEVGIPLSMACGIFEPHLIYGLVNSTESRRISEEFHSELKNFLGKELDPDLVL